jgi:prevent-host-death family protein
MKMPAGEFKAHCLRLLDDVQRTRMEIVVTKRGRPVAKLVPVDDDPSRRLLGYLAGTITVTGDIVAPVGERWEADQ